MDVDPRPPRQMMREHQVHSSVREGESGRVRGATIEALRDAHPGDERAEILPKSERSSAFALRKTGRHRRPIGMPTSVKLMLAGIAFICLLFGVLGLLASH